MPRPAQVTLRVGWPVPCNPKFGQPTTPPSLTPTTTGKAHAPQLDTLEPATSVVNAAGYIDLTHQSASELGQPAQVAIAPGRNIGH